MMQFTIRQQDRQTKGRLGQLRTARAVIDTPAFMPVGSLGPVKGLEPEDLHDLGFRLMLNNAYHLYLRPGHKVVAELGGLHAFTGWPGAILTDSGGFQIFSLAKLCKITDEGVTFQSHIDGSTHFITPETAIEIEEALGADIIMAFDQCVALPASRAAILEGVQRTTAWAKRCQASRRRNDQALFGIVQGGLEADLRRISAQELVALDFEGYAIGGLSVGESKADMYAMLDVTAPELPEAKPRYLMGVGLPEDLIEGVARGVDLFDCVVPSRHGRTGWLFTSFGRVSIKQAQYKQDERPIDPDCGCSVCKRYSRAYLHHLFNVKEMLGARLNTIHNLWYFADLMQRVRSSIERGTFLTMREEFYRARAEAERVGGATAVAAQEPRAGLD
ncbi:tRNA guanosine(34) transglycosylase Tgt [Nitrospira lenta]|uniref:Queuine tRNA-ribosyltransferase n=1 Tax=Nitrospira lenta TaxID=1436998 RepID=A0A330L7U5_9BACT|nr:tRNA guanosine(34) transglycosylase Tgt [Nitrospira lenta]SPP65752.1 tRNA-guanine transglycosylase [Nitrospira lenta]